ncbi:MAG: DsbA family oxidoreductase [Muribaculaceae bacterium]|nr:DsbA family oxidoreductase [Muribaculaceae bacterium]
MNKIMIWSDFACPYCYIGEKRLKDALKELGWEGKFEILYKAFELNPDAPKIPSEGSIVERLARKYGLSTGEAQEKVNSIDAQGRDLGIDFRYSTAKPSNTFDAHRLMKLAEAKYNQETIEKLNKNLFDAYFVRNQVLADKSVLLENALMAGLKEEDVMKTLDSEDYGPAVRKDEEEASLLGVRGVPYIVFNNKYAVPGALSIDDFKSVVKEVFDSEPLENLSGKTKSCDENGCTL